MQVLIVFGSYGSQQGSARIANVYLKWLSRRLRFFSPLKSYKRSRVKKKRWFSFKISKYNSAILKILFLRQGLNLVNNINGLCNGCFGILSQMSFVQFVFIVPLTMLFQMRPKFIEGNIQIGRIDNMSCMSRGTKKSSN